MAALIELDAHPRGQVLINLDQITTINVVPHGMRMNFVGRSYADVPHSPEQLREILAGTNLLVVPEI